jgi:hypothetical protein
MGESLFQEINISLISVPISENFFVDYTRKLVCEPNILKRGISIKDFCRSERQGLQKNELYPLYRLNISIKLPVKIIFQIMKIHHIKKQKISLPSLLHCFFLSHVRCTTSQINLNELVP